MLVCRGCYDRLYVILVLLSNNRMNWPISVMK